MQQASYNCLCALPTSHSHVPSLLCIRRRYSGLVDCALYFTHTYAERGSSYRGATTLLLDRSAVRLLEGGEGGKENPQLANILSEAQLNGIPIDTVVCDG